MFDFKDQVALVTGGSRGIGKQIARELAARGASVAVASRSADQVEAVAGEIESGGGRALGVAMDIAQADQVKAGLARINEEFEKIDILVNNAAIVRDNLLMRMKDQEWAEVLSTNLDGVYQVTRQTIGGMVRRRYGRVVNLTSVVAQMGNPGQTNYVASKAGVIGFTKALAREVASRNITVNAVAPGFIQTDMTAGLADTVRQELEQSIPLKRIGNVEDIAWGVLFLASKEAGYITGHVLNINGGMYM